MTDEQRNKESEATPASDATSPPSASETQQASSTIQSEEEEVEKSPPYNFLFAKWAIVTAAITFVVAIGALILFPTNLDSAVVTGALGALFTLIGTVAGAYFGIKKSSDTEDKAREAQQETQRDANARVQEAEKVAREAAGTMNPTKWKNARERLQS